MTLSSETPICITRFNRGFNFNVYIQYSVNHIQPSPLTSSRRLSSSDDMGYYFDEHNDYAKRYFNISTKKKQIKQKQRICAAGKDSLAIYIRSEGEHTKRTTLRFALGTRVAGSVGRMLCQFRSA